MTELIAVQDLERDIAPVLQRATSITVRSAPERAEAMEFLKAVKLAQKQSEGFFEKIVKRTHEAWKQAVADRDSFLVPLKAAEQHVKLTVTTFDREEQEQRLAEQRRLQAEADERARKERMKIEQEAAKQRAIQEEKERLAAEARRKAEEAEGAERKRLLAEAEAAERKAAAATAKLEAKEEQAATIIAPVITVAAPEKQNGEATRQRWKMKLADKAALIASAASGNDLAASLLAYDEATGNRLAASIKGNVRIPGVEVYAVSELAVRV